MEAVQRSGGCRCGRVRFRVAGAPLFTSACHCTGCQKMTGGPYSLSAFYPAQAFEVTAGTSAIGGLHGAIRHHHCAHCMSWLYTVPNGLESFVNVRTPMLDGASDLAPFIETFTSEKLPFAESGAPRRFERFPAEAEFPSLMEAFRAWERYPVR